MERAVCQIGMDFQYSLRGWIPWITSTGSRLLKGDLGLVVEVFEQPDENDAVAVIEVNNALLTGSIALKRKIFMS